MTVDKLEGSCYCKSIQFTIDTDATPIWCCYCHCVECRKAHGAPMYSTFTVEGTSFHIKGEEAVKWKVDKMADGKPAQWGMKRCFCPKCGTRVFNESALPKAVAVQMGKMKEDDEREFLPIVGTFHALVFDKEADIPEKWKPQSHAWVSEALFPVLQLKDGLEKHSKSPFVPGNEVLEQAHKPEQ
eukprot:TRINITY_DN77086_c0_g1_i1.p1 TRINITY_DN77086_c0_g1~~TRINITY_DN77086_c0_g1_i1.p1  ORF type:complete len:207 (+),score=16.60 TRINITY_DN77086_c0_g1_i1:67-621(+)